MAKRITLMNLAREEGVAYQTVRRWTKEGVLGIKLPVFFIGGRAFTTRENFAVWNEQLTAMRHLHTVSAAN